MSIKEDVEPNYWNRALKGNAVRAMDSTFPGQCYWKVVSDQRGTSTLWLDRTVAVVHGMRGPIQSLATREPADSTNQIWDPF